MVAILVCIGGETRSIAWPNCCLRRHYERGRLHRERGPAVDIKGAYEAWYQRGDPRRIKKGMPSVRGSNSVRMAMNAIRKYSQELVCAGALDVHDAYVYVSDVLIDSEYAAGYQAWTCGGNARTSYTYIYPSDIRGLYVQLMHESADTIGCSNVTELFLTCLASEIPVRIAQCIHCNALVEMSALNADNALCSKCT